MDNAGYAALQIIPSFKGFQGNLERGTNGALTAAGVKGGAAYGDAAGKSAGSRFNRIFLGAAKVGLVGAGAVGVAAFKLGKDAIAQASDLNESLNAVNVTYDKQAAAVKKLGREAADALGLSNTEFNGLAVQFSAFATQVAGGEGPKVVKILEDLTTRGADFASVMNLDVNEAMTLFQSGLAGETEPLRRFGIDMSAARVEAFAYANGIAKSGEELSEAQKIQARYKLLMEQTAKTQGDFANTSGELANQQRILSARWDNAQAKLGKALLPVMKDLVGLLLDEGIPAVEAFGDWFAEDGIGYLRDFGSFAKDAAKQIGDLVGFINKIPTEGKLAALAALVGGGAAFKLSGGGGLAGSAGSALGLARPVPVIVTNPGFGAGAGTGATGAKGLKATGGAGALAILPFLPEIIEELKYPFTDRGKAESREDLGGFGRMGAPKIFGSGSFSSDFGGMVKSAVDSADKITDAFSSLPKELRTKFATDGVPQTLGETQRVLSRYDLTPKEKRTVFAAVGSEQAKAQAKALQTQYGLTPQQKRTLFELTGYETLMGQIRNINTSLDLASRDRRTQITVAYASTGRNTIGGLQRANGGAIFGPGTGSSDDIPAWLSNGEHVWTAREVQNAGGHGAMEALRRRFRYANGGAVGSSRPSVSVGGTEVRVYIGERELNDIAVRAANRVVNAQLNHEQIMGGGR